MFLQINRNKNKWNIKSSLIQLKYYFNTVKYINKLIKYKLMLIKKNSIYTNKPNLITIT